MVVEHSIRCADYSFTIALGIPRHTDAGLNIVCVGLDSFLYAEKVVALKAEAGRRSESGRKFDIIADAEIERQVGKGAPGILVEKAQRLVGERVAWAAQALDKISGNACAVCLHAVECGQSGDRRDAAKVVDAAVVDGEGCGERKVVKVHAELGVVMAQRPGEIVGELISLFDALDVRVRFTAEIGEAGNVDGGVGASGDLRVIEVRQSPARVLEAEFIDLIGTEGPCILEDAGDVAISLLRGTRVGVL